MDEKIIEISIRKADPADIGIVSEILVEAATWLDRKGEKLWQTGELREEMIRDEVENGMYRIAELDGIGIGCFRYQNSDPEYWDDVPHGDSAFVHRVAVKRKYAGKGVAEKMIDWAKAKAREDGKAYLRLDCADRPKLRAVYEQMGFKYHSRKARSPYIVVRYEYILDKTH